MKKCTLFVLALLFATTAFAQLQKGTVLLGGTVGFNNYSEEGDGFTVINLSPTAAYFTSNRLAVGGRVNVAITTGDGLNQTVIGVAPLIRYYFNGSGNTRYFGQGSLGFQNQQVDGFGTSFWELGLGVGVDFFVNDRVAIEGVLGYSRTQGFEEFDGGFNTLGLNFGVVAFIGK
ncbi:MAG: outer membrane beta-barrel protein [Saprospiraceae bacterium]|nr:outer membrane beta-barrel protein [Saprospiraceae bacterium]